MNRKIMKVGLVGASANGTGWGAAAHIPAIKAIENTSLAALCTSRPESAKAASKTYGVERAYHNITDLVSQSDIDLISCVVKIPDHYSIVKSALEAGKNVYCEWPLGASLNETEELAAIASLKGVQTVIGLQGRLSPELNYIKKLVKEGWFGNIISVKMSMQGKTTFEKPSRIAWENELKRGATLFNIGGGHNLDYLQYCFGNISELSSLISTQIKEFTLKDTNEIVENIIPDQIQINGRIGNSIPFTFELSTVAFHSRGWHLEVFGTRGTLKATTPIMPQISPIKIQTSEGEEPFQELDLPQEIALEGPGINVALLYQEIASKLNNRVDSLIPNFNDALKIHKLLKAIEQSSELKKVIKIE